VPLVLKRRIERYSAGLGLAVAALLLHAALHPWLGNGTPFLFFAPAVAVAAPWLGRGPALMVMLLGVLNALLLSHLQLSWAGPQLNDLRKLIAYLFIGSLLIVYGARLRWVAGKATRAESWLAQADHDIGFFELDFRAGTAQASPSLYLLAGQPVVAGAMPLDDWLARFDPALQDHAARLADTQASGSAPRFEREHRLQLPHGEERWLLSRIRLEVSATGELEHARGIAIDITARKQASELLFRSQAELRQQLDDFQRLHLLSLQLAAPGGSLAASLQALLELMVGFHGARQGLVCLCDAGGTAANAVVAAHTGFGSLALQRMAQTRGQDAPLGARHFAGERMVVSDLDHDEAPPEWRELARQSGFRAIHSTPLVASSGETIGVISVMLTQARRPREREIRLSDICAITAASLVERDRARAAVQANERRFSVTLESSTVPFNILAPVRNDTARIVDFSWSYLNPAAARALGASVPELLGQRVGEQHPGTWNVPGLLARLSEVVEREAPAEFEVMSSTTGAPRWFNVIASPLQGCVAVWFADITERKRHEVALQDADRRKDEFLATLAHELRNPLAPIRQAVQIASSPVSSEDSKRWSHGVIERQVRHMALLLDDLLDVSRLTRGSLQLRRAPVQLGALVEAAVETALPAIQAKQHKLLQDVPDACARLVVDALRMSQVLANLLTNAAKYTDPGGEIRLRAWVEHGTLLISVADTGVGCAPSSSTKCSKCFRNYPEHRTARKAAWASGWRFRAACWRCTAVRWRRTVPAPDAAAPLSCVCHRHAKPGKQRWCNTTACAQA
jgi:signal transduction histidine kinase